MNDQRKLQPSAIFTIFYYGLLFAGLLFFVLIQPFGEAPDESGRFLIVKYIYHHGTLPLGDDPEVLLYGYGGSYAYQPILTYMIQGYLMRFVALFHKSWDVLLLACRLVNVTFAMIMAVYVRKISHYLFEKEAFQWLFCVAVMFLPQSLFLHTYVNTDSMALMSSAIMIYSWLTGLQDCFRLRSSIRLAIGISLCVSSYYNAYGFILCSILLFFGSFLLTEGKSKKECMGKAALIIVIVFALTGWFFIRNALLYDGDFLGLSARAKCTLLTATEEFNPLTKNTYQNQGYSLFYMLFKTDFMVLLSNSFIAMFGPMKILTYTWIYTAFKGLFLVSLLALFIPVKKSSLPKLFQSQMLLSLLIPLVLCVYYSYASDYQPQGRYILVMIIPFGYFCTRGIEKLCALPEITLLTCKQTIQEKLTLYLPVILILFYTTAFWLTAWGILFPEYYESSMLFRFSEGISSGIIP